MVEACCHYIEERCSNEDLRTSPKKDILSFSSNVERIHDSVAVSLTNDERVEGVYHLSEFLDLEIALKCLKMPVLEKKLIGHQLLITSIQKVKANCKQSSFRQVGSLNLIPQPLIAKN